MVRSIREETSTRHRRAVGATVLLLALLVLPVPAVHAEEGAPRAFDTPEAAVEALVAAAAKNDDDALAALFGAKSDDLRLDGGDPAVAAERAAFAAAAREKLTIERPEEGRAVVVVGKNEWPMPVPLVRKDGKWSFDVEAGREEILARRIGRNELEAIRICRAYAEAQVAYAQDDHDGDHVREYAQRVASTPGKHDGLYWEAAEGEAESPLGPLVASFEHFLGRASAENRTPFHGYYWKILKAQGPRAPGGAHSYVVNGNMIAGFALLGVPARYLNTGVMTFLVSHHGKILQKDLGENSIAIAKTMEAYDPDDTWTEVKAGD